MMVKKRNKCGLKKKDNFLMKHQINLIKKVYLKKNIKLLYL